MEQLCERLACILCFFCQVYCKLTYVQRRIDGLHVVTDYLSELDGALLLVQQDHNPVVYLLQTRCVSYVLFTNFQQCTLADKLRVS